MISDIEFSLPLEGQPITIAVTRGDLIESRHAVWAAVVHATGRIIVQWGNAHALIYPRSAVKPFQALPLVMSGAAQRFGLDARHVALACASHNGERQHVDLVLDWLQRLNLTPAHLECGATEPIDAQTARAVIREGGVARPEYNNCSGKHCGFLTLARHLAADPSGYIEYGHPVQAEVRRAMALIFDHELESASWGIDGCGIPTYALSIADLAHAFARFAAPSALPEDARQAASFLFEAMTAHPYLVGGRNRFDTEIMACLPGTLMVKSGAEGVCAASIPDRGLGVVTKVVDGARRASDVAMGAVLRHLGVLTDSDWQRLKAYCAPEVRNVAGKAVGVIRPCAVPACAKED